jgi:hypothetical protein
MLRQNRKTISASDVIEQADKNNALEWAVRQRPAPSPHRGTEG